MALEMRVYEELTSIEPKVMAGFTWRQLLAVVVVGAVTIGLVVALFLAGTTDFSIVSWIVIPIAVPFAAWGWVKPFGMRFEKYAGHVWRFLARPTKRLYANDALWQAHQRESFEGKRPRVPRKQEQVEEAGH